MAFLRKCLFARFALFALFYCDFVYANSTVTINKSVTSNFIQGFGASLDERAKTWLDNYTTQQQDAVFDELFSTTGSGIGLSIVQIRMDMRDFYFDLGTSARFDGFWRFDFGYTQRMKWLTQKANTYQGVTRFINRTASPPAWMKTNNNINFGGFLLPSRYGTYAQALKEWVEQFRNVYGVPISWVTPINEPEVSGDYPTCLYNSSGLSATIKLVDDRMNEIDPSIKILAPEGGGYTSSANFYAGIDATAKSRLDFISTHAYSSQNNSLQGLGKPVLMTEVSTGFGNDQSMVNAIEIARDYIFPSLARNEQAWLYWQSIIDVQAALGIRGLVVLDTLNQTISYPKRMYALGQFSRFVRPGSLQIQSSSNSPDVTVFARHCLTNRAS